MTEEPTLLPPPEEPQTAPPAAATPERPQPRNALPLLCAIGFVVLAVAIFLVWQSNDRPDNTSALQRLEQRLGDTDGRLARLEQRPPPDLSKLNARLDALEGRVSDQTQLASRMDTLSGRIESLSGRDQTSLDASRQQIDALSQRIASLEAKTGNLGAIEQRLSRTARLQEASVALGLGHPVGDLPDAPPALARYAHTAPPTVAELRLRFTSAAQAARNAKQPDNTDAPFAGRVWERVQGLISVRKGDDMLVGNTATVVLNRAQTALDSGDVAGAVSTVETLKGAPAEAMAGWLAEAKSLLNARSALAQMADHA